MTSASVLPDVAMDSIDMMRSPSCRCRRALPDGVKEIISNPPKEEGTIVAPIPVRSSVDAGAAAARIVTFMPLLGSRKISTYLQKQTGSSCCDLKRCERMGSSGRPLADHLPVKPALRLLIKVFAEHSTNAKVTRNKSRVPRHVRGQVGNSPERELRCQSNCRCA